MKKSNTATKLKLFGKRKKTRKRSVKRVKAGSSTGFRFGNPSVYRTQNASENNKTKTKFELSLDNSKLEKKQKIILVQLLDELEILESFYKDTKSVYYFQPSSTSSYYETISNNINTISDLVLKENDKNKLNDFFSALIELTETIGKDIDSNNNNNNNNNYNTITENIQIFIFMNVLSEIVDRTKERRKEVLLKNITKKINELTPQDLREVIIESYAEQKDELVKDVISSSEFKKFKNSIDTETNDDERGDDDLSFSNLKKIISNTSVQLPNNLKQFSETLVNLIDIMRVNPDAFQEIIKVVDNTNLPSSAFNEIRSLNSNSLRVFTSSNEKCKPCNTFIYAEYTQSLIPCEVVYCKVNKETFIVQLLKSSDNLICKNAKVLKANDDTKREIYIKQQYDNNPKQFKLNMGKIPVTYRKKLLNMSSLSDTSKAIINSISNNSKNKINCFIKKIQLVQGEIYKGLYLGDDIVEQFFIVASEGLKLVSFNSNTKNIELLDGYNNRLFLPYTNTMPSDWVFFNIDDIKQFKNNESIGESNIENESELNSGNESNIENESELNSGNESNNEENNNTLIESSTTLNRTPKVLSPVFKLN